MNNDHTILTMANDEKSVTVTMPLEACMNQILDAFYGACVALTWQPSAILEAMKNYSETALVSIKMGNYEEPECE